MALDGFIGWDEAHAAVADLTLLRKLASRFDPRIVQPDELAREAFYRLSELLTTLERKEEARANAYREGQKEIVDYAIHLMQHGEHKSPSLIQGLLTNFDLHDTPTDEAAQVDGSAQ